MKYEITSLFDKKCLLFIRFNKNLLIIMLMSEAATRVFYKKICSENFTKFTGKQLWQSPFLIKLQAYGV